MGKFEQYDKTFTIWDSKTIVQVTFSRNTIITKEFRQIISLLRIKPKKKYVKLCQN